MCTNLSTDFFLQHGMGEVALFDIKKVALELVLICFNLRPQRASIFAVVATGWRSPFDDNSAISASEEGHVTYVEVRRSSSPARRFG